MSGTCNSNWASNKADKLALGSEGEKKRFQWISYSLTNYFCCSTCGISLPVLSKRNFREHSMMLKNPSMTISSTYSTYALHTSEAGSAWKSSKFSWKEKAQVQTLVWFHYCSEFAILIWSADVHQQGTYSIKCREFASVWQHKQILLNL